MTQSGSVYRGGIDVDTGWQQTLLMQLWGKPINLWGSFYLASIIGISTVVLPIMAVLAVFLNIARLDRQRRCLDWLVHIWARLSLRATFSRVAVIGLENLPPEDEAVVFVPNHTSFLDILLMSGMVPRPLKYLSKSEVLRIPMVGWGMQLARHVFLDRRNLASALRCTQECAYHVRNVAVCT